jgi:eukaryotic-like serine/threonine-protein kinase
MNPDRWRKLDSLLDEAIEISPERRSAFLDQACAADVALRREVDGLLQAHQKTDGFLNETAMEMRARQIAIDLPASLIGRRLDHYQVLALIGAGGMGEVYRAKDLQLDRDVAIKVLPDHLARNSDAMARFEREAQAVAALSHPNILAIHEFGVENDLRYAAMELLEGENLRDRLIRSALSWREAVEIGAAIADGLAAAHAKGIIHRDLKPENIFLTEDGRVKILDFGLATRKASLPIGDSSSEFQAATGLSTALGTVGYVSPELLRGEKADAPSDIFSLGCVLYEMTTGRRAFERQTLSETLDAILTDEPSEPSVFNGTIPPELAQVIRRCLQKAPAARYQSARALSEDLDGLLAVEGRGRLPISEVANKTSVIWFKWLAIGTVLLLVSVLSFGWWQSRRRPSNQAQQQLISTLPGFFGGASFSPDARKIAFVRPIDGIPQIWVKNLNSGDPTQITFGETAADRPRWSPRNDQIVFTLGSWGRQEAPATLRHESIWSVTPLGGTPRKIIDSGSNPNWSGDGSQLVFERSLDIWTARADGSQQRKVEGIPLTNNLLAARMPSLSPDGSSIAFFQPDAGPLGDFWVIPSTGGGARRLTFDVAAGRSPIWTPDGRFVVFSSQRAGSLTLWKVAVEGGTPEAVLMGAGEDTDPEFSRDGRKLLYAHTRASFSLTILNLSTRDSREVIEHRDQLVGPSFSPSGDRISYFSHQNDGEIHLFTIHPDGSSLVQVTRGRGERNFMPHWSADGSSLYYYQSRPTQSFRKIRIGAVESSLVADGWRWEAQVAGRVDVTQRLLLYTLMRNSTPAATMVRHLESGKEAKLDRPLRHPRWSNDGKLIVGFHLGLTNSKDRVGDISICHAGLGPCEKLTRGFNPIWSRDDSVVYFQRPGQFPQVTELWSINRNDRKEAHIANLGPMYPIGHIMDVSPQGEIAYVKFKAGDNELWLADFSSQ